MGEEECHSGGRDRLNLGGGAGLARRAVFVGVKERCGGGGGDAKVSRSWRGNCGEVGRGLGWVQDSRAGDDWMKHGSVGPGGSARGGRHDLLRCDAAPGMPRVRPLKLHRPSTSHHSRIHLEF